jgi:hypothetical protein
MLALALAQQQPPPASPAQLGNSICQAVISIVQANERMEAEIAQLKKDLMAKTSAPSEKGPR